MATSSVAKRRKPAAKRKPSAKKSRKAKVSGTPATISLFGRRYKKSMCGLTKPDATKKADAHRAKGAGKGAVVKKNATGGYCLYKRG